MSRKRSANNNVRAGAFLILSIIAAFAIVIVLAGLREKITPRDSYVVVFDLATGATGLEEGSIVRIGGVEVGRVSDVRLVTETGGEDPPAVYATIRVDKDRQFYGDPVAHLERPLLGAGAELNFPSVGEPTPEHPSPLAEGSRIRGDLAPPSFMKGALNAVGYGEPQKTQLQNILARGDEITENISAITTDARGRSGQWFDDADTIVHNFRTSSEQFPEITDHVKQRLDEMKDFIARARAVIDDNRERIDSIVQNTESASSHLDELLASLNTKTRETLDGLLEDGRAAMADARDAVSRVGALVKEQSPNLRRSLANTRLASDQLKLTLEELRGSPWRLLYRPDTRELEFEYLYDAARTYAAAVSDLRSASESLEAVSAASPGSQEQISGLLADVAKAFTTYQEAEKRFLELVTSEAPKSGN